MPTDRTLKPDAGNVIGNQLTTLFRSPLFPVFFQIAGLIIYLGLIWFSLGVAIPPGTEPKLFAQNTLPSLIVWGIWLPLLIIVTVIMGRIWCSVCPLELIQQIGDFTGKKIFGKHFHLPKPFRSPIYGALTYAFLLFMLIATRFPQVPGNTATLLTLFAVSSLTVGLFFGNRIFCLYFCPADMLMRGLGRRGIVRIRHELPADTKRGIAVARTSCPSHLNPKKLNDASPCILCGHCVKSDTTLSPVFRPMPLAPDDKWEEYGWGMIILAFFLSGFVIEHVFHDWQAGSHYYAYIPDMMKKAIRIKAWAGWIEAIWAMMLVPGAVWLIMGLTGKLFCRPSGFLDVLKKITLPVLTLLTGVHFILSVEKFSHWVTHTQIAFGNLVNRITIGWVPDSFFIMKFPGCGHGHGHGCSQEVHLFSEPVLLGISMIVIVLFLFFLYREIRKSKKIIV